MILVCYEVFDRNSETHLGIHWSISATAALNAACLEVGYASIGEYVSDVRHAHSVDLVAQLLARTTRERVDQAFACIEVCAADDWEHAIATQARAFADALGLV